MSVAQNIIMDAAILAVLSEPADLYILKRPMNAFLSGRVFTLLPTALATKAQSGPPGFGDAQLSKFFLWAVYQMNT